MLVTGGTGYIGSHTVVELLNAGYHVIIVDNLKNSKSAVLDRIERITQKRPIFYKIDLRHKDELYNLFLSHTFDAVIHFAGLKAVGESTEIPLEYYHNNIVGALYLCELLNQFNIKKLVFSSSATVYGDPHKVPIEETWPLAATNPYGRTKLMIEEILRDLCNSNAEWRIAILRYFNPVGAHPSGLIGEDPNGIPNNLMPYITQVAIGKQKRLSVFGTDYATPDGSGVRDYIHVVDLAIGHLRALEHLQTEHGVEAYNLGTGRGYSVFEIIKAFEKSSGKKIPYTITDRRPGDIAMCYANPDKAQKKLKWNAVKDLNHMCADAWRWQSKNPNGYA
ncbi:UDP-glucose 4-epimerase GalE [candidate division KSB1 bacterium]|nr:MAG: UDP-glucose 4-epimerase GalE [candidate division KSB1 bacterium]